jgi:hypothetical protein
MYNTITKRTQLQNTFAQNAQYNHFTRCDLLIKHLTNSNIPIDFVVIYHQFTEYTNIEEYNEDYGTNYKTIQELAGVQFVLFDREDAPFIVEAN